MAMKIGNQQNHVLRGLRSAAKAKLDAMEKLASGLRINAAGDDAAGMAIASGMRSQSQGMSQALRNANDGVSLTQIADGGMSQISGMLGRMRELGVQAANGTLSNDQRALIDEEYQQLKEEIDRVSNTTEFNGIKLLDGSQDVSVQAGPNAGDRIDVELDATDGAALGVDASSVTTAAGAMAALDEIDAAMETLTSRRVSVGAQQNRLGVAMESLTQSRIDTEASRSRIEDADMAAEAAALAMADLQSQAGVAMQAQANQSAGMVIQLLN